MSLNGQTLCIYGCAVFVFIVKRYSVSLLHLTQQLMCCCVDYLDVVNIHSVTGSQIITSAVDRHPLSLTGMYLIKGTYIILFIMFQDVSITDCVNTIIWSTALPKSTTQVNLKKTLYLHFILFLKVCTRVVWVSDVHTVFIVGPLVDGRELQRTYG